MQKRDRAYVISKLFTPSPYNLQLNYTTQKSLETPSISSLYMRFLTPAAMLDAKETVWNFQDNISELA